MTLLDIVARAGPDPLVRYALLGAAVLALASLLGGWSRGDVRALGRPATWIALALAIVAAVALTAAGDRIGATIQSGWPLEGVRRLPLYLLALGYGPTVGALAGLAFAAVEARQWPLHGADALLALELAAVGWIAIAPSPRRHRLAAPLAVLLGWSLATATLGLAAWAALGGPATLAALLTTDDAVVTGVLASALFTAFPSPRWWRGAAPGAARGITGSQSDDGVRWQRPLRRSTARTKRRRALTPARMPRPLRRTSRPKRVETPPRVPAELASAARSSDARP
ncbi:MAG: hypothetical protein U5J97_05290 [Trueperaceae bacterium]|nr:hypothetical protein [Trueperaceae bacterium]